MPGGGIRGGASAAAKRGVLLILLGGIMWGTLPAWSRIAYALGSDPVTAASMRAYLSALAFLAWFLLRGNLRTVKLRELPFYLCYGLLGIGGTFLLYMTAVKRLPVAMAAMLLYTGPAFVILLSRLFYRDPITKRKLAALVCTFGGCFLVVRGYDPGALTKNAAGIVIGILSGVCYSMVTVLGRVAQKKHDAVTNAGLMTVFGALLFLPLRPPWTIAVPTASLWACYLAMGLVTGAGAYTVYLKGLATGLDGGIASVTATVEPVVVTVIGAIFFGDLLEAWQVLGIAVVLLGIAIPFVGKRQVAAPEATVEKEA